MPEKKPTPTFDLMKNLTDQERDDFDFVQKRIVDLKEARKDVYGMDLEKIWEDADKDYVPHKLRWKGKKVIAESEELGWRGRLVELGKEEEWQSDISQPNPYIKIQIALGILIDRNPTGMFLSGSSRFEGVTSLMKQLYERSWEMAKSKQQLKLFVFNDAKYGWACGRTYPLKIARKVKKLIEYNEDNPEKSTYEETEIIEYNDIFRENLDIWNAWIDDMARPNNSFSMRDWCWRKVYAFDQAKEEFNKYKNWKFVKPGGVTKEKVTRGGPEKKFKEKKLVEIYFYENRIKDLFMVIANNVPIIIEPLPISDAEGNKKLSCWQTYWTLRHAECPYGVGIYEAIKNDQIMLDRIRNMTIDQLTLSIYKMFFYTGTEALTETGRIKISPGVGKQILNPQNIRWLEIAGPGAEAWAGIEKFKSDMEDACGVTPPLAGEVTGKTAFEIAQAKEAALKRMKIPLENICDALETEGGISISLIQLLYSIPEVIKISDPNLIDAYLKEIESDPELWERSEEGEFSAKLFREFPLNLDKDEKGNLVETPETRFFRVKPKYLKWEGIIKIKPQSILTPSVQLDKALDLEMMNILIPLIAQDPTLYGKIAKNLLKIYEKDPKEWLPDMWLGEKTPVPTMLPGRSLIVPQEAVPGAPTTEMPIEAPEAERFIGRTEIPARPQGVAQRISGQFARLFRKV